MMPVNNPMLMKLSASWEIEKSSPNVVPRLCNLSISEVVIDRPIETETHNSFFVAVRMRDNARRVLRSPEILLSEVVGAVSLDLSCSIQYSHMLKRDSNILQILIQRRKKYKSKTMNLGYKTLAYCNIDLAQVMQRRIENKYLELYDDPKSNANSIGRIEIQSLSTIPAEKDVFNGRRKDLEEEYEGLQDVYSEQEDSDHGDDSDYDPMGEEDGQSRQKKIIKAMSVGQGHRRPSSPTAVAPEWQKQIKQKFVGFLKKMKFVDPNEELDPNTTSQLWDEIDQIETVSDADSDIEIDTLSVQSTPRPTLRPFFGHTDSAENTLNAETGAKLAKSVKPDAAVLRHPRHWSNSGDGGHPSLYSNTFELCESSEENSHSNESGGGGPVGLTPLPGTASKHRRSHHYDPIPPDSGGLQNAPSNVQPSQTLTTPTSRPHKSSGSNSRERAISLRGEREKKRASGGVGASLAHSGSPSAGGGTSQTTGSTVERSSSAVGTTHGQTGNKPSYTNSSENRISQYEQLPRSETQEQVTRYIDSEENIPSVIFLVNVMEPGGKLITDSLLSGKHNVITIASYTDTRYAVTHLINKAQKQSRLSNAIKVCLLGGDSHVNSVLRVYVDQLTSKSTEMIAHFRFYLVPLPSVSSTSAANTSCGSSTNPSSVSSGGPPLSSTQTSSIPGAASPTSTPAPPSSALSVPPFPPAQGFYANMLARHLCQLDSTYASLFGDLLVPSRQPTVSGAPPNTGGSSSQASGSTSYFSVDGSDLVQRISSYLSSAQHLIQFPIGECLVVSKFKGSAKGSCEEEPGEAFVPFVSTVRLGDADPGGLCWSHNMSVDQDDLVTNDRGPTPPHSPNLSSPTQPSFHPLSSNVNSSSPPGSYHMGITQSGPGSGTQTVSTSGQNLGVTGSSTNNQSGSNAGSVPGGSANTNNNASSDVSLDLQLEYWLESSDRKFTSKSAYRGVNVSLSAATTGNTGVTTGGPDATQLNMILLSKEKKQKIMRIGKKSKETESRREFVESISRLICTGKTPMKVIIDGVEWPATKFFQVSPFWRTHVKLFPLASFSTQHYK